MKYSDIEEAYEMVSVGSEIAENNAYVSKTTGEIFYDIDENFSEEKCPDFVFEDDDYVQIPGKYDLDLGTALVWRFVRQEIPGLEDKVRNIFRKRGAYSRYKDFLRYNELLEKWYEFERVKTKEALLDWCSQNGIKIEN